MCWQDNQKQAAHLGPTVLE